RHRHPVGDGHAGHLRKAGQTIEELRLQPHRRRGLVGTTVQHGEQPRRVVPGFGAARDVESAQQQARWQQQHHGHRDLATDEQTSFHKSERAAPAPAGGPPSYNAAFPSPEEPRNAGESPKAKPAASETAKVYANTRRSGDSATNRPPPPCRNNCTVSVTCSQSIRAPHIDNNNPPKPPASASSRLSVSS